MFSTRLELMSTGPGDGYLAAVASNDPADGETQLSAEDTKKDLIGTDRS